MARYSVCMVCNDSVEIIDRFVTYYLQGGASEIFVYLDFGTEAPDYGDNDNVTVITLESMFVVDGQPKRPANWHQTQRDIYADAYARCDTEWLLICDADEFVAADRPITDVLDDVPEDWKSVHVPVAEAVWGPGDPPGEAFENTYFRTRAPRGFGKLLSLCVYGAIFNLLKAGLMGHADGKHFLRKGSGLTPGIHRPLESRPGEGPWTNELQPDPNMFVYHFEAVSYARWIFKWGIRTKIPRAPKRKHNAAKLAYMDRFAAHQEKGTERKLFDALYQLNNRQVTILKWLGLLHRRKLW